MLRFIPILTGLTFLLSSCLEGPRDGDKFDIEEGLTVIQDLNLSLQEYYAKRCFGGVDCKILQVIDINKYISWGVCEADDALSAQCDIFSAEVKNLNFVGVNGDVENISLICVGKVPCIRSKKTGELSIQQDWIVNSSHDAKQVGALLDPAIRHALIDRTNVQSSH